MHLHFTDKQNFLWNFPLALSVSNQPAHSNQLHQHTETTHCGSLFRLYLDLFFGSNTKAHFNFIRPCMKEEHER